MFFKNCVSCLPTTLEFIYILYIKLYYIYNYLVLNIFHFPFWHPLSLPVSWETNCLTSKHCWGWILLAMFLFLTFCWSVLCLENRFCNISVHGSLLRLVLWPNIWSIFLNISCAIKRTVYSAELCNVPRKLIGVCRYCSSNIPSFHYFLNPLVYFLSITEMGFIKRSITFMSLSISNIFISFLSFIF